MSNVAQTDTLNRHPNRLQGGGACAIIRSGYTNGYEAFFVPLTVNNLIVVGGSPPSRRHSLAVGVSNLRHRDGGLLPFKDF